MTLQLSSECMKQGVQSASGILWNGLEEIRAAKLMSQPLWITQDTEMVEHHRYLGVNVNNRLN